MANGMAYPLWPTAYRLPPLIRSCHCPARVVLSAPLIEGG